MKPTSPAQQQDDGIDGDDGDSEQQPGDEYEDVVAGVRHQDVGLHVLPERQVPINPCGAERTLTWRFLWGTTAVTPKPNELSVSQTTGRGSRLGSDAMMSPCEVITLNGFCNEEQWD